MKNSILKYPWSNHLPEKRPMPKRRKSLQFDPAIIQGLYARRPTIAYLYRADPTDVGRATRARLHEIVLENPKRRREAECAERSTCTKIRWFKLLARE